MGMSVFCLHVCVGTTFLVVAEARPEPLKVEFQTVVGFHVGAQVHTQVLCKVSLCTTIY